MMEKMIVLGLAIFLAFFATDLESANAAHILETKKTEHDSLDEQKPEVPAVKGTNMEATAYCINGRTASGTQTRVGIAAAKKEWLGKTAIVYTVDKYGNPETFIGNYKVEDTGGEAINSGRVIDIWFPTREECINFGRKSVYVMVVDI